MKDFRLALRQLIRSPGLTLLAIITLGLGIGANTAMFSALNSILLKPLPYPESAQLDRIATLLLIGVALVACWIPARRAARINPIEALRAE